MGRLKLAASRQGTGFKARGRAVRSISVSFVGGIQSLSCGAIGGGRFCAHVERNVYGVAQARSEVGRLYDSFEIIAPLGCLGFPGSAALTMTAKRAAPGI